MGHLVGPSRPVEKIWRCYLRLITEQSRFVENNKIVVLACRGLLSRSIRGVAEAIAFYCVLLYVITIQRKSSSILMDNALPSSKRAAACCMSVQVVGVMLMKARAALVFPTKSFTSPARYR
jgi:hypothetical protein